VPEGVVVLGREPWYYGTIHPTTVTKIDPSSLVNPAGQPAVEAYISVEEWPIRIKVVEELVTPDDGHLYVMGEKLTVKGIRALHNLSMVDTIAGPSTVRITIFF